VTLDQLNDCSRIVVDSALHVHSALGPGLLESAYLSCLKFELESRKLFVESQLLLPLTYKQLRLATAYRIDLRVERELIVEVKAVTALHPIHEAQLLSYLRLSSSRLGLLLNFHVPRMKDGIKRLVNRL
jgi:GxxExxY protein